MTSDSKFNEKREFVRVEPLINPIIYDAQSSKLLGTMVDLSAGGFKIAASSEMVRGEDYYIKIILQDENAIQQRVLAKVNVRWSQKGSNPGFYTAGCNFIEVEAGGRLHLASLKKKKRKTNRVNLVNYPVIYDANANILMGTLIDVNVEGIKFFAYKEMEQFKNYLLKIISVEKDNADKSVVVNANVRWCAKKENTAFFTVGCLLREVQAGGSLKLSDLMRSDTFVQ